MKAGEGQNVAGDEQGLYSRGGGRKERCLCALWVSSLAICCRERVVPGG